MNKKNGTELITGLQTLMEPLQTKESEIEEFCEAAEKTMEDLGATSNAMFAYFKAEGKLPMPIPGLSNPTTAQILVENIMKLLPVATDLANEIAVYRNKYNVYCENATKQYKSVEEFVKSLMYKNMDNAGIEKNKNKFNSLLSALKEDLDKLREEKETLVPRIESVKNQLQIIKGVN